MSEQTANLCTTDACESLRARLAKYEDAEGRPVAVGDCAGLFRDLRELAGVQSWASEPLSSAADALEYQAREIERLKEVSAHFRMQASIQAQEARTQKAIVTEIGALVGEPNDFLTADAVRAALTASAPNHGEQVREYGLSRESLTLAYRLITKELETLANGSAIDRFKTAQGEFRSAIAAAPSAGSQEQGE